MADLRTGAGPRPDEVAARTFPTSFRGYDPDQVRSYLARVAEALGDAWAREDELREELEEARAALAHPEVDEALLLHALGEEAARLLQAAREAAADVRRKADAHAAEALDQAHTEAEELRAAARADGERITARAESVLGDRTAEAERAAEAILAAARQEGEQLKAAGLAEARAMVAEAKAVRERMLGDLRRKVQRGEASVEVLRAGRDKLLEAYGVVRDSLDEATHALATAEARARQEAEEAAAEAADGAAAEVDRIRLTDPDPMLDGDADERPVHTGEPSGEVAAVVPIGGRGEAAASAGALVEVELEQEDVAPDPVLDSPAASAPATGEVPVIAATGTDSATARHRPRRLRLADEPAVRAEERRLAELRYLHRPRRGDEPEVHLPEDGMVVLEPPALDEAVRVLRTAEASGADERPSLPAAGPQPVEPQAAEPDRGPDQEPEPEPVAIADEPEVLEVADAPEVLEVADAPEVLEVVPQPDVVEAAATPPPAVDEAAAAKRDASALFAKLRAERTTPADPPAAPPLAAATASTPTPTPAAAAPTAEREPEPATPAASVDDELLLQARDAAVAPVEHLLAKRVKRLLQDHQNDVLDRLRAKKAPTTLELLGAVEDLLGPLTDAALPLLGDAATAGAASMGAPDGAPPVDDLAADVAANIIRDLRPRLEAAFGAEGVDERSEAVAVAFREWRGERVGRLVGDAAHAAYARGAFVATPARTKLRWVADDGEQPCAECEDDALAGPTRKGQPFPTGHRHPPVHSGCRCLLVKA